MLITMPSIRRACVVPCCVLAMLATPTGARASDDARLVFKAVSWEVEFEQQTYTIHGLAAEGRSMDIQGLGGEKPLRVLLMPAGWNPTPNDANAQLVFSIKHEGHGAEAYDIIDLEFGAALVDLGTLDDLAGPDDPRLAERADQMRQAVRDFLFEPGVQAEVDGMADPRPDPEAQRLPIPADCEAFAATIESLMARQDEAWTIDGADRNLLDRQLRRMSHQEVIAYFGSFWPMIITRSVTAGAQGTNFVLMALPTDGADPGHFVCLSKFISGVDHNLRWKKERVGMDEGDHVRVDIRTNVAGGLVITNEAPTNVGMQPLDWAEATLTAGWQQVFGS